MKSSNVTSFYRDKNQTFLGFYRDRSNARHHVWRRTGGNYEVMDESGSWFMFDNLPNDFKREQVNG